MPAPKFIGVAVVVAAIGGYIPGVPGLLGGDPPPEEQAAAEELLPPAPDVVPVETGDPVLPDDGLIRVIVTPTDVARPTGVAAGEVEPSPADADTEGLEADVADAAAPEPAAVDADPADTGAPTSSPLEPAAPDSGATGDVAFDDYEIAAAALAELTNGAVLELDEQGRPWAVWVAQDVRVPLWMDLPAAPATPVAAPTTEPTATAPPTPATAVEATAPTAPAATGDDIGPNASLGHPTADLVATLPGVGTVVSVGDGSFAVALQDPAVLDGLPLTVVEDPAMGIGSEPYEGYQWALDNNGTNLEGVGSSPTQVVDADIDGLEARDRATGRGVVVAVIDSGVDFSHRDLVDAQWINHGERCGNGIDDDTNGYVDDCSGWDFGYEDNGPFNTGAHPHGTHVAGIIAAAVDGYGVAGVAPKARIMDLNVGTLTRSGQPGITTSAVARAIRYAADNGADVINLSLGTPPGSPRTGSAAVESAIGHAEAQGVVVVAAAGNDGTNLDGAPSWPASYENTNMVTVGASSPSDTRASFSNYGSVVDVFAPGELILSAVPASDGTFTFMSGTSQATPIVAGVAALLLERTPGLTPAELRSELIGTADRHQGLTTFVPGGVRVNAANAVGLGEPAYSIDELGLSVSGLHDARAGESTRAVVDVAVPDGWFDDDYVWTASLFAARGSDRYGLVGLPVSVDGVAATTDDRAGVSLGFDGSGDAEIEADLPAGDYALVVEATPSSGGERLGPPHVVTFAVAAAGEPTATAPAPGDGSAPADSDQSTPADGGGPESDVDPPGDAEETTEPSAPAPSVPGETAAGGGAAPVESAAPEDPQPADPAAPSDDSGPTSGDDVPASSGGDAAPTPGDDAGGPSTPDEPVADATPGDPGDGSTDSAPPADSGAGDGGSGATPGSDVPPPAPATAGEWTIESVTPHTGPTGAMTLVQLNGDFPRESYVWFGEAAGTVLLYSSRMLLVLSPPAAAPGAVDISLRRTGEGTVLTVPGAFTYLSGLAAGESPAMPSPTEPAPDGPDTDPAPADDGGGDTGSDPVDEGGADNGSDPVDEPAPADPAPQPDPGGEAPGSGPGAPDDEPTSTRETRVALAAETTDLGGGLRGALVLGDDPVSGAPACQVDPCPMG